MSAKMSIKKAVPAKPDGIWTCALDFIDGSWRITLRTTGPQRWKYSDETACSADGDLLSSLDRNKCICPKAPVGALIGKVGGSTADISDPVAFVVGQFCVIDVDPKKRGPLFLTINDELTGFVNNSGQLEVDIEVEMIACQEETKKSDRA